MLRRVLLIAAVVLAVAFVVPGGASAAAHSQLIGMLDVAHDYFGDGECGGAVATEFVPAGSLDGDDAPDRLVLARGGDCKIAIDNELFTISTWVQDCELIVHEWGHAALDLNHSADPHSIMYPEFRHGAFKPCRLAVIPRIRKLQRQAWRLEGRGQMKRAHWLRARAGRLA